MGLAAIHTPRPAGTPLKRGSRQTSAGDWFPSGDGWRVSDGVCPFVIRKCEISGTGTVSLPLYLTQISRGVASISASQAASLAFRACNTAGS